MEPSQDFFPNTQPNQFVECFEAIPPGQKSSSSLNDVKSRKHGDVTGNRNRGLISAVSVSCDVTTFPGFDVI